MVYAHQITWLSSSSRHILATLHFNENVKRQTKTTKDGKNYVNITYLKFKFGEEVVRNIAEPPTYSKCNVCLNCKL